jgi:mannose-6-phosphate isomerase
MSEAAIRPWGRYIVIDDSTSFKVKQIWVTPGERLSYQRHEKRSEHWFIVQGSAEVTLDGVVSQAGVGDSVDVPVGVLHRIKNIGTEELLFVEVQTGTYFGEDDIVRVEDDFGRV